MKSITVTLAVIALFAMTADAYVVGVTDVITPLSANTAKGSEACHLNQSFDNQPTWDGVKPVNTVTANADSNLYTNRWGYMDFGPDWDKVRIEQIWTRWRQWSGGQDQRAFEGGFFTNIDPTVTQQVPGPVTETRFNFSNQPYLPYANEARWLQDADFGAAGIALGGRYLVLHTLNPVPANPDGRAAEAAYVGHYIPEPATMTLLALGAVSLLRRRA